MTLLEAPPLPASDPTTPRAADLAADDLRRCRRGDPDAIAAVQAALGDRLFRLCLGLLGHRADAEDATQDVFVKVLDRGGSFAGRSSFTTWVYRVATNHCLNLRRRRALRATAPLDELTVPVDAPGPEQAAFAAEERTQLHTALAALSPEHRAVLVLRELEQLSYDEIAAVLSVPPGTVMSRLSRARTQLLRHTEDLRVDGAPASNPFPRTRHGL